MYSVIPESVGLSSERLARITPVMQGYVDRGQVAGLSTLVARHGKIAHLQCFGQADVERGRPVNPDTIFRIYSMSKPITAVAALMLYERGLYTLYDPISKYIPAFKSPQVLVGLVGDKPQTVPAEREITIKDLFCHTAGLSYGFGDSDIDKVYRQNSEKLGLPGRSLTTAQFIDALASLPLAFQPGSQYLYSWCIDVLGRLVEVLSGMTFGEFLKRELFDPLGMNDTGFYVPAEKLDRFAALYQMSEGGFRLADGQFARNYSQPPAFESGGGGLVSTLTDYARFAQMLVNGGELDGVRILSRKTVQLMGTNHLTPTQQAYFDQRMNKRGYGYGLGVRVMHNLSAAATAGSLGEFGWDGAASTWFCVDPVEDLIAVHMIQMMPFAYYPIMLQFQALVYQALL